MAALIFLRPRHKRGKASPVRINSPEAISPDEAEIMKKIEKAYLDRVKALSTPGSGADVSHNGEEEHCLLFEVARDIAATARLRLGPPLSPAAAERDELAPAGPTPARPPKHHVLQPRSLTSLLSLAPPPGAPAPQRQARRPRSTLPGDPLDPSECLNPNLRLTVGPAFETLPCTCSRRCPTVPAALRPNVASSRRIDAGLYIAQGPQPRRSVPIGCRDLGCREWRRRATCAASLGCPSADCDFSVARASPPSQLTPVPVAHLYLHTGFSLNKINSFQI